MNKLDRAAQNRKNVSEMQDQFIADVMENQCQSCQRRRGTALRCEAFPDGIPPLIFLGIYDHTHPYNMEGQDDHGITYAPKSEASPNFKQMLKS